MFNFELLGDRNLTSLRGRRELQRIRF